MTARITFSKTGYARYISHLDLQRAMMRIFRRAALPLWMTKGFNPHPYLNFCSPLSVGIEGENEYLDVKLSEVMSFDDLKERLSEAMPTGFKVKNVEKAERDFGEAEFALYRIVLDFPISPCLDFLAQDSIPAVKKTKSAEMTVDLKQLFKLLTLEPEGEKTVLTGILPCGRSLNINPLLLVNALCDFTSQPDIPYRITRIGFLDKEEKPFRTLL